jgi:hypothetical protein
MVRSGWASRTVSMSFGVGVSSRVTVPPDLIFSSLASTV